MHERTREVEELTEAIVAYAIERLRMDPPTLDGPVSESDLQDKVGQTITREGLGGIAALKQFVDVLAPACISVDHPRQLAFVPAAPTEAATLFDLVVGASSICGSSWLEGSGAVFAENQALRWLAELAHFPASAGGVFVSGGTAGNLSALVAARHDARGRHPDTSTQRALLISSQGAHASIRQAAHVMDADIIEVGQDRLLGSDISATLAALSHDDRRRLVAIAATAGTTNLGLIDDLAGIGEICQRENIWFHVDGAYGLAALVAPSVRDQFAGIELADSFIVDPHKWLFAPFDSCALIYRNPLVARAAHRQHAGYLEALYDGIWNPSDYAHHLSRRARGLPLWFSLAAHGTQAYSDAVEATLQTTKIAENLIQSHQHLEMVIPSRLSIVVFRRIGWSSADYARWSDQLLSDGVGFVTPTKYLGETVLRFCIVNPRTTEKDLTLLLETLNDS